jgi:hypothetical protein
MGNIIMKENDHDKLWIDCAVPPRRGRRKQDNDDNDDIAATTTPLDPRAAASRMMKRVPAMSDKQTMSPPKLGENLLLSRAVWRERTPSIISQLAVFFLSLGLLDNVSKWNSETRNIEPKCVFVVQLIKY